MYLHTEESPLLIRWTVESENLSKQPAKMLVFRTDVKHLMALPSMISERTVKTNMLEAGVNKVHRDVILGHSLKGMDVHYLALNDKALHAAMGKYTKWFDQKMKLTNVDQTVDQTAKN
jgi:hypothetical protein